METIIILRQGGWPAGCNLTEMEKNLVKALLQPEADDRPYDLTDVIEVIDYLIETEKGKNKLE